MPRLANILRLGVKELRSLRADPVLLVLVAYAFSVAVWTVATGVRLDVRDAAVAVVDEDRSTLSRAIAAALLPPQFRPPQPIEAPAVGPALDAGRQVFVLEIPPRFESDLLAGRPVSVLLQVDATAMAQAGNGTVYIREIVQQEVAARLGEAAAPINLVIRARFNPNLQSEWFGAVMQLVNSITILSVILPGAALLREREHGTLEHLLAMPVTPFEILASKLWANGLVIVAAALLSLLLVVRWAVGVPLAEGSVPLFAAGTVLYQFSVAALGMLLATATASTAQFGLVALPVLMVLYLLSGGTTPLESMPVWLQYVVQISPATHFVGFAQAVLYRGAGLDVVAPRLVLLAGFGAAFLVAALSGLRRSLARAG